MTSSKNPASERSLFTSRRESSPVISTPSLKLKRKRFGYRLQVFDGKLLHSQFYLWLRIALHFHHESQERSLEYFSILQADAEMRTVCFGEFAFLFLGHWRGEMRGSS